MDGQLLRRVLTQDQDLEHLLKRDPRSIVGVYTLEELNTAIPASLDITIPIAIIVNTEVDPTKLEGEHWVAIYSEPDDHAMDYFDSFGLPPTKQAFYHFFNRQERAWRYNKRSLQHPLSSVCGYYCLYFLLKRCRNTTMAEITLQFGANPLDNDDMVHQYIHKHYRVKKTAKFVQLKQQLAALY